MSAARAGQIEPHMKCGARFAQLVPLNLFSTFERWRAKLAAEEARTLPRETLPTSRTVRAQLAVQVARACHAEDHHRRAAL